MKNGKKEFRQKPYRTLILFSVLTLAVGAFLISVFKTSLKHRNLPPNTATVHDRGLRGSIISKDGYTLSRSGKTYQATIFTQSLNPDKKDLFIKLFSIYSGISTGKIAKIIKKHKGYTVLAKKLDNASAVRLKSLAYRLRRLNVFVSMKNKRGMRVLYGLDISENGEKRFFPLKDTLSPVLGYVRNRDDGRYTKVLGVKGLERRYEKYLGRVKNGFIKGMRDVGGTIIRNKNCITQRRQDGMDVHLNIPLKFQRRVEMILSDMKNLTQAQEIIAGVMESHTGKILALASSERYRPDHITQKDVYALNPKFSEFLYEPGSVMKPITLSVALKHHVVTPDTWFDTSGGRLKISEKYTIKDDEIYDSQTATDIIVHSSNVGISKIAWRLTGKEFHDGIQKFGLGKASGIDLSRELPGKIKNTHLLENKLHRANQSYGYGMLATFAQLWKAYSAFNNNGIAVTPRIVEYLQAKDGKKYMPKPKTPNLHSVDSRTANQIKKILKKVVSDGTGKAAIFPGLEIGGKTGTAHIVEHRHYINKYNSSFYGFANDNKGNKYSIGVLAIRLDKHHMHFASQSAVPTFKKIVSALVEMGYLKPDLTKLQEQKLQAEEKRRRELAKRKQQQRTKEIKAKLRREREEIRQKQKLKRIMMKSKQRKKVLRKAKRAKETDKIRQKRRPTPHEAIPDLF